MSDTCRSDGNTDLYGLGNRLGIYFQMIAFIIAGRRGVMVEPLGALISSINVSLLATFIAVVKAIANGTMRTVDMVIIDSLIFTQVNLPLFSFDLITLLMSPLAFGMQTLVAWFWFVGLDKLPRTDCPDDYGFFFSEASLYGWFSTLWKVLSVGLAILTGIAFLAAYSLMAKMTCRSGYTEDESVTERREKAESRKFKELVFLLFPFTIIMTECTVAWNNLDGVYSVGSVSQLIPLILGIGLVAYMSLCHTQLDEARHRLERSQQIQRELHSRYYEQ
ncbi:hypothetical protein QBC47DRAFT_445404 [Echria macrotheca]|uniref:Uncharacterized protein n=1 Tax=Echria macrotheca TaxID=438768 RepID=A0AAJ0F9H9_9PEZI|nr:hypothetical protein QBC47DRAFT_445404 [Echria macrotheca]